jgi:hypothetical protein
VREDRALDVPELAELVIRTGLSGLARQGGKNPGQTLGVQIRKKWRFIGQHRKGSGLYEALPGATSDHTVSRAIKRLEEHDAAAATVAVVEADVRNLIDVAVEGDRRTSLATWRTRETELRLRAVQLHKLDCFVCGFNFEETYGELGKFFIEVHHRKPLAEFDGLRVVSAKEDLCVLCSNCHRMLHRRRGTELKPEELRQLVLARRQDHRYSDSRTMT